MFHARAVKAGVGCNGRAFQAIHHARFVALRLQTADEPGARVAQTLVIQVHGVLCCQDNADAKRARLLEQGQQRQLGRRVGDGREITKNLIHVHQGAQAGRARLRAHPTEHLVEQQGDEKHTLCVAQVGNGEDRDAGFAFGRVNNLADVQGHPFHPAGEAGRRHQIVQRQHQAKTILSRVEGLQIEHPDTRHRRRLDGLDERGQVEISTIAPGLTNDGGNEDVLAAGQWVGVDADHAEQAGHGGVDALLQQLAIVHDLERRHGKGFEDRNWHASIAAWSIDDKLSSVTQALDARPVFTPVAQALFPQGCLLIGILFRPQALLGCIFGVDPGQEILAAQLREGEEQVTQVAFGVNQDGRDAINGRLFDQADAQAGLARTGHPHTNGVGYQVFGIVEDEAILHRFFRQVILTTQIEHTEFLKILHRAISFDVNGPPGMERPHACYARRAR